MNRAAILLLQTLALAALVWVSYWGSLNNPFVFDDWHVIPQNPAVREIADIPGFFSDPTAFSVLAGNQDYRPVFLSSMALCWSLGDGATLPFHVMSISIHLLNCLLLLFVLRFAFNRGNGMIGGLDSARADAAAFFSAAIFAVHPLNSESVVYISSQSVPLTACFYLLGFLLHIRAFCVAKNPGRAATGVLLTASVLSYGIALLCKPIAISFPLVLVLWELLLGGRNYRVWKQWIWVVRLIPYGAVSAAYIALRGQLLPGAIGPSEPIRPYFEHYLTETKAMVFYYLKLTLLPFGQNADPEFAISTSLQDPEVLASLAVIVILAVALVRFRTHRVLLFWSLWFPVGLLVTAYATVLGQVVNEHRVYLSLAGFSAVVGLLGGKLWLATGRTPGRTALLGTGAAILVALSYGTATRSEIWSSEITLWGDSAAHGGTWRAHMNYALALERDGRAEEALFEFQESVRIGSFAWAHVNLGHAYVRRGQLESGLAHLRTAVRLWPDLPEARLFLGYGLDKSGQPIEAETEMKLALELRPNYLRAYEFLGSFYEGQNNLPAAIDVYQALTELDPHLSWVPNRIRMLKDRQTEAQTTSTLFDRAFAEQQLGHREDAIPLYEELLSLDPNHRQGTFNLAYAYRDGDSQSSWQRSAQLFATLLELDPGYTEAYHHRATVLWKLGRTEEAARSDRIYLEQGHHDDLKARSRERISSLESR